MKTTIIELLNKIANGEQPPKKIYYLEETFTYDEQSKNYYDSETYDLFDSYEIPPMLNDEVEILETTIIYNQDTIENNKQHKIEKLNVWYKDVINQQVVDKINEVIDFINKEK